MTTSTDRAREVLRQAVAEQWSYRDLLDLAIKQHESLRGEHLLSLRADSPHHQQAVREGAYERYVGSCPECAVLLQWEQMWEAKKTE